MHVAPLTVVFVLIYYAIPLYAEFGFRETVDHLREFKELTDLNFQQLFVRYCFSIGFRKK